MDLSVNREDIKVYLHIVFGRKRKAIKQDNHETIWKMELFLKTAILHERTDL